VPRGGHAAAGRALRQLAGHLPAGRGHLRDEPRLRAPAADAPEHPEGLLAHGRARSAGARQAARRLLPRRLLRRPLQGREQQGEVQEAGAIGSVPNPVATKN